MNIVKVISSRIDQSKRRLIKYLRYGKDDVQESFESSPFGIDSTPLKDMIALYAPTGQIGEDVIIGYVNKNKLSEIGEIRLYSVDSEDSPKAYIHLKNNGEIHIDGDSDNAVRYSELKKGFDELKDDHNDLLNKWNAFAASYVPGTPSSTGSPPTLANSILTPSIASVDNSKIDNVKTS